MIYVLQNVWCIICVGFQSIILSKSLRVLQITVVSLTESYQIQLKLKRTPIEEQNELDRTETNSCTNVFNFRG